MCSRNTSYWWTISTPSLDQNRPVLGESGQHGVVNGRSYTPSVLHLKACARLQNATTRQSGNIFTARHWGGNCFARDHRRRLRFTAVGIRIMAYRKMALVPAPRPLADQRSIDDDAGGHTHAGFARRLTRDFSLRIWRRLLCASRQQGGDRYDFHLREQYNLQQHKRNSRLVLFCRTDVTSFPAFALPLILADIVLTLVIPKKPTGRNGD
jgi:hypothetical protein